MGANHIKMGEASRTFGGDKRVRRGGIGRGGGGHGPRKKGGGGGMLEWGGGGEWRSRTKEGGRGVMNKGGTKRTSRRGQTIITGREKGFI